MQSLLNRDPSAVLTQLACPILVINGSQNVQVDSSSHLPAIQKALEFGKTRIIRFVKFQK
jgi:hypothetical protein